MYHDYTDNFPVIYEQVLDNYLGKWKLIEEIKHYGNEDVPNTRVNYIEYLISYGDFLEKELILDNCRSFFDKIEYRYREEIEKQLLELTVLNIENCFHKYDINNIKQIEFDKNNKKESNKCYRYQINEVSLNKLFTNPPLFTSLLKNKRE